MRLAHLKCPNCDGFVEFTDSQELFCKSCGSELMIHFDPEDFELEELKAMPEILNDKYEYEKKLYESELKSDEEANKQRLVQEWRENSITTNPQKKRKFVKGYVIALVAFFIFMITFMIVFSIIQGVASTASSQFKSRDSQVDMSKVIKLEIPSEERPVESFVDLRNTPYNSFDDITYCMENYLRDLDDPYDWETIEFKNAFIVNEYGTSKLLGAYEETDGSTTICRVVELSGLMFDPDTREVKTSMNIQPLYGHSVDDMYGVYSSYDEFVDTEITPKGDAVKSYN